jgi:hypothetical protein
MRTGSRFAIAVVGLAVAAAVTGFVVGSSGGNSSGPRDEQISIHSVPQPSARYALGLNGIINRLNAESESDGSRLRSAHDEAAQARIAHVLAADYARASAALLKLGAGQASGANRALAAAVSKVSDAYAALASAAARNDPGAYRSAQASLAAARGDMNSAFSELGKLGYRVG